MPNLMKMLTLEALSEALPSWLKRSTKPEYNADEIDSTLTTNQFVSASDKENWNSKGTYSKPSGGIPKSDLASAVQTSLGKADTALQSFTETDPTVPSWAKASSKPSYTQDEVGDGSTYKRVTSTEKSTWNNKGTYSKPSGGIPKSDLASAVQTSLGKADTALQSFTETDPTVPSWAKQSSKPSYTASEVGAIATSAKGAANGVASLDSAGKVPSSQLPSYVDDVLAAYGTCDTAADVAAKVVTLASDSKFTLVPGSMVAVLATYTNTASNPTLNVNGTGAKPIVYGTAVIETTNLAYATYANRQHLFMYDGTNYIYLTHNVDNNSTYSNASLGQGYGTCTTAAATAAKVVTLSNYALATGGIVSVKFSYDVPASATMNINSKGAKAIYHRGAAITAGVIKAGDTATFIYSTYYHLISIDRDDNTSAVTGVKGDAETSFRTGNVSITPANIGAVALTGNTITGDIQRKQTEIDASKANNNISATKYPTTYSIIDNSGRILVRNEAIVEPSGNISWYAYVRNYNTSGGQVAQKGIKYTVNKSGTGAWTVDDSASFKSAIGLSNIDSILSPIFNPAYIQPTKHSNITSIDDGGYIQIGKLTILNMRFTVGTACGQWTDIFTDCPLPLSSLSGGYGVVACSSNTDQAFAICANGRLQNYSGTLNPGSYVVSACYMTQ